MVVSLLLAGCGATRARVEEQRLLVDDEELVEREAPRHLARGDRGADPVDGGADLVDVRSGLGIRDGHASTYGLGAERYERSDRQPSVRPSAR
jgi:hypothetical protein